jgi:hypothetical protein
MSNPETVSAARAKLTTAEKNKGRSSLEALDAALDLAVALILQGKNEKEADALLMRVLRERPEVAGVWDQGNFEAAHRLGVLRFNQADLEGAKTIQSNLLQACRDRDGDRSASAFAAVRNLTCTLVALGQLPEVETVASGVVDAQIAAADASREARINDLFGLAETYRATGDIRRSSSLYKRTINRCLLQRREFKKLLKACLVETFLIPAGLLALRLNPGAARTTDSLGRPKGP